MVQASPHLSLASRLLTPRYVAGVIGTAIYGGVIYRAVCLYIYRGVCLYGNSMFKSSGSHKLISCCFGKTQSGSNDNFPITLIVYTVCFPSFPK
jgi:hypothetical protein